MPVRLPLLLIREYAMFAEERRQLILDFLKQKKRVDVADLAEELSTSPETIRRDLNEMETAGLLKRTHGGAILQNDIASYTLRPLDSRRVINADKKARIAKAAAGLVENGDVIAIDNSTTACRVVDHIPADFKLTVVTYSLQVIYDIARMNNSQWTCISLGGIVNMANMSTHGLLTSNALNFFQPRKFFMSCAGVSPEGLLTEGALLEAETKRELMRCSQKIILMVDDSKWGKTGVVNEGDISGVDCLVINAETEMEKVAIPPGGKLRILFDREAGANGKKQV